VTTVDLTTTIGSVRLANPVMTASGTAGYGDELGRYLDLGGLGAVVVKSLSPEPWAGNAAPRVHETTLGMINSVGLQNGGVAAWLEHELPALERIGATVVASIWGFTVADFEAAAAALADAGPSVVAIEVNVSCPNIEDRRQMFGHSAAATAEVVASTAGCGRPRWVKLSPNVTDLPSIAEAAMDAGASALTLINTVMGMAIDPLTRRPRLGAGGGGLSGPAIHPIAVRAVWDCRVALPDAPIIGVGGVSRAEDAIELLLAGAHAVQVGTATFADPRAPARVLSGVQSWCRAHGVTRIAELIGASHD
jgi:dihydroorotate dehydrogenase (NAD+) catalytic subunit